MKTLEDFTEIQRKKFLFAQIISNVLTISNIKHKIGGSFVNFINGTRDDFHDVDIIVNDDDFDDATHTINDYIKCSYLTALYSFKNSCIRVVFEDGITIDILADIIPDTKQTFNNIELESEENVNKARAIIRPVLEDIDLPLDDEDANKTKVYNNTIIKNELHF